MKSLKRRFHSFTKENPSLGGYTILCRAVKNQNFGRDRLVRNFSLLIQKEDFDKSDKKKLIDYLIFLTKDVNSTEKEQKIALERPHYSKASFYA